MSELPEAYRRFRDVFPELEAAWDATRGAEEHGPLDLRTRRLVKLAIAIGAERSGTVRSAARKALAAGVTRDEILHVVAQAPSTLGFPGTVAVLDWIDDVLAGEL
jgi:4-carboxymuconolactone decarboxylase